MTIADGDKRLSIKSWSEEDRPREKLLLKGKEALSNAELIAILLGSGTKKLTALDVAKQLLDENGNNLNQLSLLSVKELCKLPGIGNAKAVTLLAAAELGRRRKADKISQQPLNSSQQVFEYVYPHLADLGHEKFYIVVTNQRMVPLRTINISAGGTSATVVDAKIIFKKFFEVETATSMFLAHNHPSGNLKPSTQDKTLTQKLVNAAKTMDIQILDHIIVGSLAYYSFADEGILPR
ncbi:MAG: DNA repair protein RadC [Bacteroidia bacterium]